MYSLELQQPVIQFHLLAYRQKVLGGDLAYKQLVEILRVVMFLDISYIHLQHLDLQHLM